MMKAVRVYNNNVVSAVAPDGRDVIYVGTGIGFHKKPGDLIDEDKIEKKFYIQDELQTRFLELLKDVCPAALIVSEEILEYAKSRGMQLKDQLLLSLTDHISFALDRYEQGIDLPYLVLTETKLLYPAEFEIGVWGLDRIALKTGVRLDESEAGYIALQLASSSMSRETTYRTLEFVKGALDIIKSTYGLRLKDDDLDTMRLTTHLKFLAQRIFKQEQWQDEGMEYLLESMLPRHQKNRECLKRLSDYTQKEFSYTLNEQEKLYILVHLTKIIYK